MAAKVKYSHTIIWVDVHIFVGQGAETITQLLIDWLFSEIIVFAFFAEIYLRRLTPLSRLNFYEATANRR